MHDVVLAQEVQRDQDLDCKALDQRQTKSLEVVHLDEVVQIHGQQLERYDQVFTENELVELLDDVLFVFRVFFVQCFN